MPQYGIFVKEMCKGAGIDVKLEILSQAEYYGSGDNQPWLTVPAGITDWASRGTASQTIGPRTAAVRWNSAHWCDRFERLMHEFDGELDLQRRRRAPPTPRRSSTTPSGRDRVLDRRPARLPHARRRTRDGAASRLAAMWRSA